MVLSTLLYLVSTLLIIAIILQRYYFPLLDRRITDIKNREKRLQSSFEDKPIREYFTNAKIDAIRCYSPDEPWRRLLRYCFCDFGRTQVTVLFADTAIKESYWRGIEELVELEGYRVVDHGPDYQSGGSYITVELDSLSGEDVEKAVSHTATSIHKHLGQKQMEAIPDW